LSENKVGPLPPSKTPCTKNLQESSEDSGKLFNLQFSNWDFNEKSATELTSISATNLIGEKRSQYLLQMYRRVTSKVGKSREKTSIKNKTGIITYRRMPIKAPFV
jgi:hypothetical protein